VNVAVGKWRAVVEVKSFMAFVKLQASFIKLLVFPVHFPFCFPLGQVAPHWELGLAQVQRILNSHIKNPFAKIKSLILK
jgi:hypothetical protein